MKGKVLSSIALATTLAVMISIEWRLALLSVIVLPLFLLPARRVGKILRKPVVVDDRDTVAVRPTMSLSLVFDHRLVDGAPAARFLQRIKELVEKPYLLLG